MCHDMKTKFLVKKKMCGLVKSREGELVLKKFQNIFPLFIWKQFSIWKNLMLVTWKSKFTKSWYTRDKKKIEKYKDYTEKIY